MDDDLRSLMNRRDDSDDDLFGSFTDPDDLGFDAGSPFEERAGDLEDFDFSDPFALSTYDEPAPAAPAAPPPAAATVRAAKAPTPAKAKKRRRRAKTGALGMTAPQRMVLAIFLFLDVAVIGLLILIATNAINLNF